MTQIASEPPESVQGSLFSFVVNHRRFAGAVGVLSLLFALPLWQWFTFALGSDLYSHVVLVPIVSVALVWINRHQHLPAAQAPARAWASMLAAAAAASVAYALVAQPSPELEPHHRLVWLIAGYVLGVLGLGFWCLGLPFMRANAVPAAFLVFMIPMPGWLERATEFALQRGSAEAAQLIFSVSSIPFLRDGQVFRLPSITMEIAQECSGIHSSLVLFIVSIVAGQVMLPPGWRRWTLTLFVVPLALVRNGFRVFTLGYLCEHIGPHMINHWIHHRGGPVFFALSLIPFFLLLFLLNRLGGSSRNSRVAPTLSATSAAPQSRSPAGVD